MADKPERHTWSPRQQVCLVREKCMHKESLLSGDGAQPPSAGIPKQMCARDYPDREGKKGRCVGREGQRSNLQLAKI